MTPANACPYCGSRRAPVHVHGHAQCVACGINISPCCDGASAGDEISGEHVAGVIADPALFQRLFAERLGGAGATVTAEALQFALVDHADTDLAGARVLIEAGEHTGTLVRAGAGLFRLPG